MVRWVGRAGGEGGGDRDPARKQGVRLTACFGARGIHFRRSRARVRGDEQRGGWPGRLWRRVVQPRGHGTCGPATFYLHEARPGGLPSCPHSTVAPLTPHTHTTHTHPSQPNLEDFFNAARPSLLWYCPPRQLQPLTPLAPRGSCESPQKPSAAAPPTPWRAPTPPPSARLPPGRGALVEVGVEHSSTWIEAVGVIRA